FPSTRRQLHEFNAQRKEAVDGETEREGSADHRRRGRAGEGGSRAVRARRGLGGGDRHRCCRRRVAGAAAYSAGRKSLVLRQDVADEASWRETVWRRWRVSANSTSWSTMLGRSPARAFSTLPSKPGIGR